MIPVYVVHWRSPDTCARTVASLDASVGEFAPVIVIDNSEDGGTALRRALDPSTPVVVAPTNDGFTGGANAALRDWLTHWQSDFAVIANHDVIVDPTCLQALVVALRADGRAALAGPASRVRDGAVVAGGTWNGFRARYRAWEPGVGVEAVGWVKGELLAVRRSAIEEVGGFDLRLGSYVEDVDLSLRMRQAGWSCVVVSDEVATSAHSMIGDPSQVIETNVLFVATKHGGPAGLVRAFMYLIWLAARCGLAMCAPTRRSLHRRRQSYSHLRRHVGAMGAALRQPRLLASFLREPRSVMMT